MSAKHARAMSARSARVTERQQPPARLRLQRGCEHAVCALRQRASWAAVPAPAAAAAAGPPARVLMPQRLRRLQVALPDHRRLRTSTPNSAALCVHHSRKGGTAGLACRPRMLRHCSAVRALLASAYPACKAFTHSLLWSRGSLPGRRGHARTHAGTRSRHAAPRHQTPS